MTENLIKDTLHAIEFIVGVSRLKRPKDRRFVENIL